MVALRYFSWLLPAVCQYFRRGIFHRGDRVVPVYNDFDDWRAGDKQPNFLPLWSGLCLGITFMAVRKLRPL